MFVMQHEIAGEHYLIELSVSGARVFKAAARSLDPWGSETVIEEATGATMSEAFASVLGKLSARPRPEPRRSFSWLGFDSWRAQPAQ